MYEVVPSVHAAFLLLVGCFSRHTAHMPAILSLPDLDALDPAALKALVLLHQDRHESLSAALSSRTTEIDRLKMLVNKLQRMLFGAKSEKVLRQIEQLELQLEELSAAEAVKEKQAISPAERPSAARPFVAHCRSIFRAKSILICPITPLAPTAAAVCASSARMSPRSWRICVPALR